MGRSRELRGRWCRGPGLGIARALAKVDAKYISVLRRYNLLTRDAREVERKKYGRPGARKRFQFSKR